MSGVNGSEGHGASVKRVEDPPFLRGTRPYTDDLRNPEALYAVFVRSGFAHAKVGAIDTSEAASAPGVVGVYTAADLNLEPFPTAGPPVDTPDEMRRPVLARDRVRFIGEPVAVVVADTREHAVDASQLVDIDYDPLDVLIDMTKALDDDAPQLFSGGNLAAAGPPGKEALDDAEVRVGARFVNQRVAAVPMEPGAALAAPDPDTGGWILWTPSQGPHAYQSAVCKSTGIEKDKLRVISSATGGGFGARIACYPEQVVVVALARELGRAVRYIETRSETMLEMQHGRAQVQDVEIGGTRDGRVTGLKVRVIADCGAYPADAALMPMLTGLMSSGVYDIPKVDFHFDCVVTNTTPIGAYRGAGRPEATALVERAIDMFAAEIGMDPAEVRRKNFITDFPHQTVTGANYDSGEYHAALDKCLANAGYDELRAEQARRRASGDVRQLGLGLCSYVEWTGFGSELGTCAVEEDGSITVTAGTSSHGQGHETAYAQLVAGTLGVRLSDVRVIQSDTAKVARGMGTAGSRSLQIGGTAVQAATDEVLEKAPAARGAPAGGGRGGHRGRPGRGARRGGLARVGDPVGRPGAGRGRPVTGSGGLGGWAVGRERLRHAGRDVPVRDASGGRRGRHRDRHGEPGPAHHRRRRGPDREPDAGRGPGPRRHRPGRRAGAVRGDRLRRGRQQRDGVLGLLRDPVGGRPADLRDRAHADADAAQPAGREGHRRGGCDRRHARRLERRRRCALAVRRQEHRHARHASARLAGAQRGDQLIDLGDRRPEPDARPDRAGQLGLAAGLELFVEALGLLV